jgi:hypothetical protein
VRAPIATQLTVLRRDRVEELAADGETERKDFHKEAASREESCVHAVAAIESRIIDQTLPTEGRSRLLEVDPHDNEEPIPHAFSGILQAFRVLEGSAGIVD